MNLRPYQLEALAASNKRFKEGITRQIIALPTGTGKTPLFSMIRSYFGFTGRVLILVHREELAAQAADKLQKWNPNETVGVEMASSYAPSSATFVVAGVATLGRASSSRLAAFDPSSFDAVITDECHHSTAKSYTNIFNHFGCLSQNSKTLLLGVTATPNRGDGTPLAQVYDEIVYQKSILEAIREGWLVNLKGIRIHTGEDLDNINTRAGDFEQDKLALAVNTPERNDLIVRKWIENAHDRQSVVFCVDIQHAKDLSERFNHYGIASQAIWGDDPERATKLRAHRGKHLRVLTNCGVLTEGYDDPGIGCIVLARPTKSGLLFVQMAGRGTRLPEGVDNLVDAKRRGLAVTKDDCIVLDVVDNTQRHSLSTLNSLFGLGNLEENGKNITELVDKVEAAKAKNPDLDMDKVTDFESLEFQASEVDLFKIKWPPIITNNSMLQWHQNTDKDSFVLMLPLGESMAIVPNMLNKYAVVGSVHGNKIREDVDDLPEAFRVADLFVSVHGKDYTRILKREARWMAEPMTERQVRLFQRLRVPIPEGMTKGDAHKYIGRFMATKSMHRKLNAVNSSLQNPAH